MKKQVKQPNRLIAGVKFVLTRAIIFYLCLYGVSRLFVDSKRITEGLKMRTLNVLMPQDFTALFHPKPNAPFDQQLAPYVTFYTAVTEFLPERNDGHGMLGYCYAVLGDYSRARLVLQDSTKIDPPYFWNYWNLAILYFQQRDYAQASYVLEKAVKLDPKVTIHYLQHPKSLYYLAITRTNMVKGYDPTKSLIEGYYKAFRVLAMSMKNLNRDQEAATYYQKAMELKVNYGIIIDDRMIMTLQVF